MNYTSIAILYHFQDTAMMYLTAGNKL